MIDMVCRIEKWLVPLSALLVLVALGGCGEEDVRSIITEEEVLRYIDETEEGKELFRIDGLINPTPYSIPFDSGVFKDVVLSHERASVVYLVPSETENQDRLYPDYGALGRVREALVEVEDKFSVQTTRTYSDSAVVDTSQLILKRYGFFLRLGDRTRPFAGWMLWGFSGLGLRAPPVLVYCKVSSGGPEFRGDFSLYRNTPRSRSAHIPEVAYVKLGDIDTVKAGRRLTISTTSTKPDSATYQLASDYGRAGAFTGVLYRYDPVGFRDSLSYLTPPDNPRFYNLFLLQALTDEGDEQLPHRRLWCVPYHI